MLSNIKLLLIKINASLWYRECKSLFFIQIKSWYCNSLPTTTTIRITIVKDIFIALCWPNVQWINQFMLKYLYNSFLLTLMLFRNKNSNENRFQFAVFTERDSTKSKRHYIKPMKCSILKSIAIDIYWFCLKTL